MELKTSLGSSAADAASAAASVSARPSAAGTVGASGRILTGDAVTVGAAARAVVPGTDPELLTSEKILEMLESEYQAAMTIAKNLAPSKRELELRARRMKELLQLRHELTERTVEEREAYIRLRNIIDSRLTNGASDVLVTAVDRGMSGKIV